MRIALAITVASIGFVLSVYFGLVVMFVGGIDRIVDEINAETADGVEIAWGILQIVFAWTSFIVGVLITFTLASVIAGLHED